MSFFENKNGDVDGGKVTFFVFLAVMGVVLFFILIGTMFYTVGPGTVGVTFDPFSGGVSQRILQPGFGIKAPWVSIYTYNARLQEYTMSMSETEGQVKGNDSVFVVARDGITLQLDCTIWYKIDELRAPDILRTIGVEGQYQVNLVRPAIRNAITDVASTRDAGDIYGAGRESTSSQMFASLRDNLQSKFITVEKFMLRGAKPPAELTTAINEKMAAQQAAQKMEYTLQSARLEKDRKVIEAQGIADANKIISTSLTPQYLDWYWLEGLKTNAGSHVVYMMDSKGPLPLFKNIDQPIPVTP